MLADEVYQENVYTDHKFVSFNSVLNTHLAAKDLELISFHSVSKGLLGECGRRGGYFHCKNISKDVLEVYYKMLSVSLCSNTSGQIMVDMMVKPPEDEPSKALFETEKQIILGIYIIVGFTGRVFEEEISNGTCSV
jgi:alanine transaminase